MRSGRGRSERRRRKRRRRRRRRRSIGRWETFGADGSVHGIEGDLL